MRKFILILCLIISSLHIVADDNSSKNLYFVYIDHEPSLPVNRFCREIKRMRVDAIETGDALVVYLANNYMPMISCTNVIGVDEKFVGDDAFDNIIGSLQDENSHNVDPQVDVEQILSLAEACKINDASNNIGYKMISFDFYVGKSFWDLQYTEKVLSHLYFSLDIPELQKNDVIFNVYNTGGEENKYDANLPFGIKNINGINKIRIMDF